jgi:tyrosyl-tRNA synthetase
MAKVSTDKALIEEFLTRGVEAVFPTVDELRKKLQSGDRLKVYQGYDPTGAYLHVGHAMGIRALGILQKLGHEVIFLVGDYTALIGDPDKDKGRRMLTAEEIEKNMSGWKEQAAQLIHFSGENAVQFRRNSEWLSKVNLGDAIKLMSHMTVQQMLERDMFERRMKNEDPISLHEFIYPLMQGYDGVMMDVDMEIGGADQIFNMLVGRSLSKAYKNKNRFVRANKMMDAPDGRTMSKTKGNGINLGDSAADMYGKAMSYPDSGIVMGLELLTNMPMKDIEEIKKAISGGENPMNFKKVMAYEIVKMIKGEKEAASGQESFEKTVQHKELPDEIPEMQVAGASWKVVDLIAELKLAPSKSEARRLISGGGVKIDGEKVADANSEIKLDKQIVLQVGKRQVVTVSHK